MANYCVTEIIYENKDQIYRLMGMTKEEAEKKNDERLFHNGVRQKYCFFENGSEKEDIRIFDLTEGETPYTVGYIGQHLPA